MQARTDEEFLEADADVGPDADGAADENEEAPSNGLPWAGSDRDYVYEELLGAETCRGYVSHLKGYQKPACAFARRPTQVVLAFNCGLNHGCPIFSDVFSGLGVGKESYSY